MRFFAVSSLALAALASAKTILVTVGDGNLLSYSPNNIQADVGDIVAFEFRAKNHTVTQSTFAAPCTLANINSQQGIDSGFFATAAGATTFAQWQIQITQTTPLWFFCRQLGHCQKGMVMAINATPDKTFAMYQAAANATTPNVSPAGPIIGGTGTQTPGGTTTGTTGTTGPTTTSGAVSLRSAGVVGALTGVAMLASMML